MFNMCQCWCSEWITCVILFYSHHNRNASSVTLPTRHQRKSPAAIIARTTTTSAQQASFGFRIDTQKHQSTQQLSWWLVMSFLLDKENELNLNRKRLKVELPQWTRDNGLPITGPSSIARSDSEVSACHFATHNFTLWFTTFRAKLVIALTVWGLHPTPLLLYLLSPIPGSYSDTPADHPSLRCSSIHSSTLLLGPVIPPTYHLISWSHPFHLPDHISILAHWHPHLLWYSWQQSTQTCLHCLLLKMEMMKIMRWMSSRTYCKDAVVQTDINPPGLFPLYIRCPLLHGSVFGGEDKSK